jgi:1-acyl-sn-glycerol-3-phosphate acyltransferase
MTAVLQARIQTNLAATSNELVVANHLSPLDPPTFAAYTGSFQIMAIITVVIMPGILLFRVLRSHMSSPTTA